MYELQINFQLTNLSLSPCPHAEGMPHSVTRRAVFTVMGLVPHARRVRAG